MKQKSKTRWSTYLPVISNDASHNQKITHAKIDVTFSKFGKKYYVNVDMVERGGDYEACIMGLGASYKTSETLEANVRRFSEKNLARYAEIVARELSANDLTERTGITWALVSNLLQGENLCLVSAHTVDF